LDKRFDLYLHELIAWNNKFNLTAITKPEDIRLKHFADSLALLKVFPLTDERVLDIGSGAGFPGLPLKLACPGIRLTLLEATRKKTEFLKHLVTLLQLKNVEVVWGRSEEYQKIKKNSFDVVVARAVAKLDKLAGWALPLVTPGGHFIAYKEEQVEAEAAQAAAAIAAQRGRLQSIEKVRLDDSEIVRSLVIIAKT